jgi:hypothetical protein
MNVLKMEASKLGRERKREQGDRERETEGKKREEKGGVGGETVRERGGYEKGEGSVGRETMWCK